MKPLSVGLVGCGLIGCRRAKEVSQDQRASLRVVTDVDSDRSQELAKLVGCRAADDWKKVVDDKAIDVIIVSTPNGLTAEIGIAALNAGKHVLVEKPPGKNMSEARQLAVAARRAGRILKVGFNHRYHPAISRARQLVSEGAIGQLINMRARYGHGGRPGYEKEWRGNPALAGGGELTDQGVHLMDLFHWFAGLPDFAIAVTQTAVWPISPLEDNAFGLFQYANGMVASFHTSWTQWKNLFSFEVFGHRGFLIIEGLGGSYGTERLVTATRNPAGGAPSIQEEVFDGPDGSWQREWADFMGTIETGSVYWGTPEDGLNSMVILDALYRSARTRCLEPVCL
jgi:predicted dehydrogenase